MPIKNDPQAIWKIIQKGGTGKESGDRHHIIGTTKEAKPALVMDHQL